MAFILLRGDERKCFDANSNVGCDYCNDSAGLHPIVHDERDFCRGANVLFGCGRGFRGSGTVRVGEQASRLGSRLHCSLNSLIFA
jgi:hypothetical protein